MTLEDSSIFGGERGIVTLKCVFGMRIIPKTQDSE